MHKYLVIVGSFFAGYVSASHGMGSDGLFLVAIIGVVVAIGLERWNA